MGPLTTALEAYIATTKLVTLLWESASDAQRKRLLEIHLKREEWWQREVFDKLGDLITSPPKEPG